MGKLIGPTIPQDFYSFLTIKMAIEHIAQFLIGWESSRMRKYRKAYDAKVYDLYGFKLSKCEFLLDY